MKKMTSRERVLAAMKREDVDYVPCDPSLTPGSFVQRIGKKWQLPFGNSMQEKAAWLVEKLEVDHIVTFAWGFFQNEGCSSRVWIDDNIIYKEYTTPAGKIRAAVNYSEDWPHGLDIPFLSDYNIAHYVQPWIETFQDVECLKHLMRPPQNNQHFGQVKFLHREVKAVADKYDLATKFYFGHGLTGAQHMFGTSNLCYLTVDDPELVKAYLEVEHSVNMRNYEIALDFGTDIIGRDSFYETCDFFSTEMLKEFTEKHLREWTGLVHQAGKVAASTYLTGIMPMLDWLSTLDIDCISYPDFFFGNMSGADIVASLGDKKSFVTGPSDTIQLPTENENKVREAVRYVFETVGKRGLILSPCSSGKAIFPWSNIEAMIDEWKKIR